MYRKWKTGYLVKPDSKKIADKIEYLFSNPKATQKMGLLAYNHIKNKHTQQFFKMNIRKSIINK